jgi:hypothetical protein
MRPLQAATRTGRHYCCEVWPEKCYIITPKSEIAKKIKRNEVRVTIGSETKIAGFTLDEAVRLFQNVPDFNEAISRNYLEYRYRGPYHRYRCDTLLDKAGPIILPYCRRCKLPWASVKVKEVWWCRPRVLLKSTYFRLRIMMRLGSADANADMFSLLHKYLYDIKSRRRKA